MVPWNYQELDEQARKFRDSYEKLLEYVTAGSKAHVIFYEDMVERPTEVWEALQDFLVRSPNFVLHKSCRSLLSCSMNLVFHS